MTRILKLLAAATTAAATAAVLTLTLATPVAAQRSPDAPVTRTASAPTYHPSWHRVHFHMNAYRGVQPGTGCSATWSDHFGVCVGQGERFRDVESFPFDRMVGWQWHTHNTACPPFPGHRDPSVWVREVKLSADNAGGMPHYLCGWVDAHWGTFMLTGGSIVVPGYLASESRRSVSPTSAVVADREHTKGGPLFMFLGHRTGGYVMGLRGWLYY